jgi:hypothetical protein
MIAAKTALLWTTFSEPTAQREESSAAALIDFGLEKQWQAIQRQILAFKQYQADWDGFQSAAPDPVVVDNAIELLRIAKQRRFEPPARAALAPDGCIAIEWLSNEISLEAEISASKEIAWVEFGRGRKPEHWSEDIKQDRTTRAEDWDARETVEDGGAVSASEL